MSLATDIIDALVCGLPARERISRKLAMLTAFFDDSGTHRKGPFCVLAGYIANADQWKAFSDEWDTELRSEPKLAHLKMSQANVKDGPFRGWDTLAIERKVTRLAEIINRHAIGGIAVIVSNEAYRKIAEGYLPSTMDHPYWLCYSKIVMETLEVYGREGNGEKINFVFDTQGEGYERRALLMHDNWREIFEASPYGNLLGSLTFGNDLELMPLQAADMLAWHVRRHADRKVKQSPEDRPLNDVLAKTSIVLTAWQPQEISDFVDWYQENHPLSPINRPDLH